MMFFSLASLLALASAAVVSPSAGMQEEEELGAVISPTQMFNMSLYAEWAGAAYCNYRTPDGAQVECANDVCPTVVKHGGQVHSTFAGGMSGVVGFIGLDPVAQTIVLSFRGTNSLRNFVNDFTAFRSTCTHFGSGCRVHMGFDYAWSEVSSKVTEGLQSARAAYPGYTIVTTGHSLGGAMSILSASYLRQSGLALTPYSYGAPRVGNGVFVENFGRQPGGSGYRVTHLDDPVPRVPPAFLGYRHTTPEYWLANGTALTNLYRVRDIEMCRGMNNVECNAGTTGFDVTAHSHYLTTIGGCSGSRGFRKRDGVDGTEGDGVDATAPPEQAGDTKPFWDTGPMWFNGWEKTWLVAKWEAIFALDRQFMRANPS